MGENVRRVIDVTLTKYIVLEDDDKAKPALLFFCLLLCYW
jgi:hypothetical protein